MKNFHINAFTLTVPNNVIAKRSYCVRTTCSFDQNCESNTE